MNTKETILDLASKQDTIKSSQIIALLSISRQAAHKAIKELVQEKKLIKFGTTARSFYASPEKANAVTDSISKKIENKNAQEHDILNSLDQNSPILSLLTDDIRSIFDYAFSEMANNAIDHSKSKTFTVTLSKNKNLIFDVNDSGIGVFHSIKKNKKLPSELEAIRELLKGKTTTMPQAHSGEGIFFTSKIADLFTLESHKLKLVINNRENDITVIPLQRSIKGTKVHFEIDLNSPKHLTDIFKKYQSDDPEEYAFEKTDIHVRLYTIGGIHVSRSQARRILNNLDKFKVITMDFDRVPNIGQAFADEIFRVFPAKHPEIKIIPINTNETVNFMIQRAISTKR